MQGARRQVDGSASGADTLVHQQVAVVVNPVAPLEGVRVNGCLCVVAIRRVVVRIAVGVQVGHGVADRWDLVAGSPVHVGIPEAVTIQILEVHRLLVHVAVQVVRRPVAIFIEVVGVADFEAVRVDVGSRVIAVAPIDQVLRWHDRTGHERVGRIPEPVEVEIRIASQGIRDRGIAHINQGVAVVVEPVAEFEGVRVDVGPGVVAVECLPDAGFTRTLTVVTGRRHDGRVSGTVTIRIHKAENAAVTVPIQPVARQIEGTRVDAVVGVVAVIGTAHVTDRVHRVLVHEEVVRIPVAVAVLVSVVVVLRDWPDIVRRRGVAVVIEPVASDFNGTGVDVGIEDGAVKAIENAIVITVAVARNRAITKPPCTHLATRFGTLGRVQGRGQKEHEHGRHPR